MLGIETARLLLHGPKRSCNSQRSQLARCAFRRVHVGSQFDAVTVLKRDLLVVYLVALGERLVPLLSQCQRCIHIFFVLIVITLLIAAREHHSHQHCG